MQKIKSIFPEKKEFFCNYAPLGIIGKKPKLFLFTEPLSVSGTAKTTDDTITCLNGMVLGRLHWPMDKSYSLKWRPKIS